MRGKSRNDLSCVYIVVSISVIILFPARAFGEHFAIENDTDDRRNAKVDCKTDIKVRVAAHVNFKGN